MFVGLARESRADSTATDIVDQHIELAKALHARGDRYLPGVSLLHIEGKMDGAVIGR